MLMQSIREIIETEPTHTHKETVSLCLIVCLKQLYEHGFVLFF